MLFRSDLLSWPELQEKMDLLRIAMRGNDVPLIRDLLKDLVIGYRPDGDVVDWVWIESQKTK